MKSLSRKTLIGAAVSSRRIATSADYYFDERDHETIALFRELARWASSRR